MKIGAAPVSEAPDSVSLHPGCTRTNSCSDIAVVRRRNRIFVERLCAGRQLHPGVPAAVVDGNPGRRKMRIGKRPDGDADAIVVAFFGVEDGCSADRAEPEYEPGALVPDSDVFGGGSDNLERSGEAGQGRKDAAGPLLAG